MSVNSYSPLTFYARIVLLYFLFVKYCPSTSPSGYVAQFILLSLLLMDFPEPCRLSLHFTCVFNTLITPLLTVSHQNEA